MNPPAPFSPWRLVPWAMAAALGGAALWVTRQNVSLQQENAAARTERSLAEVALHLAQNRLTERSLLAEGMINSLGRELRRSRDLTRLKVIALAPPAGGPPQVIVVWDAEQAAGLVTFDRLPAPDASQDYQLWVTDAGAASPVSGGIVPAPPSGPGAFFFKPAPPVAQAAAFAISLEKKGGVLQPGGTFILLGK